jgi:hypothetical protein
MKHVSLAAKIAVFAITFGVGTTLVISIRALMNLSAVKDRPETTTATFSEVNPEPLELPTPENTSLADKSPQYLCDQLADLKRMAWTPTDHSGDAVYDGLKRNGYDAMPCLVDKITDMRPASNPTGAPFWAGLTYRVGDTAVLMLMDINEMYWPKGMLPKSRERHFKDEGMFYYYFYVHEVPGGRKHIQQWWRNWLKTCRPECWSLPTLED